MKVAIITPTYNRSKYITSYIHQLSQQTYKYFSLIIIDAGSRDFTLDIARKISTPMDIITLSVPNHYFWTAATNVGIQYALNNNYDAILTINDDTYFKENLLASLVDFLKFNREYSMVSCRVDYYGKTNLIWQLGAEFNWHNGVIFTGRYSNKHWETIGMELQDHQYLNSIANCGNGVLFRKEVFIEFGFYNQFWCPHYHADTEYTLRCTSGGLKLATLPRTVIENDFPENDTYFNQFSILSLLFSKKSPFYIPSWLYIIIKYCPFNLIPKNIILYARSGLSLIIKLKIKNISTKWPF